MAGAFRILLWAVVLLAPGGILLAPLLAAHELRRRNRAAREAGSSVSPSVSAEPTSVASPAAAVAASESLAA